jgi:Na+/H+ antiporter NhaC
MASKIVVPELANVGLTGFTARSVAIHTIVVADHLSIICRSFVGRLSVLAVDFANRTPRRAF